MLFARAGMHEKNQCIFFQKKLTVAKMSHSTHSLFLYIEPNYTLFHNFEPNYTLS